MFKLFLLLSSILLSASASADGILVSWSANSLVGVTKEKFEDAKQWTTGDILSRNLAVVSWPETYLLLVASLQHAADTFFLQGLIQQITNSSAVKLQFTNRLIIWERITRGDILFEGKGIQIDDDLFTVAGRANFFLRNITKHNFGLVVPLSTSAELRELQTKWKFYAAGKMAEPYQNPFETQVTRLREIQSLSALEALITSLRPSDTKEQLTKTCLMNLYHLTEMPKEKGSASFCNPDTYALSFLGILTGDKKNDEKKNYAWWSSWWIENKGRLTWNKEKAIFETAPH